MNTGSTPKTAFTSYGLVETPYACSKAVAGAASVNHVFAKPPSLSPRIARCERRARLVPAVLTDDVRNVFFGINPMRTNELSEWYFGRSKGSNVMWQKIFSTLKANANQVFVGLNLDNGGGGFLLLPKNLVIGDKSIETPGETIPLDSIISILIPEVFSQGKVKFTNDIDALKTLLETQTGCSVLFKENNPKSIQGRCLEISFPV